MWNKFFIKQPMMRKVIYALIPLYLFGLYLYGPRLLWLSLFTFIPGIAVEYIMEKKLKKKNVSEAVLVTCTLYTLSLPPQCPWWIASIGIVFGVLFGKEVFGGFGRNVFNPAVTGRLFVYIAFNNHMNSGWYSGGLFGFADTITSATPLSLIRNGQYPDILNLIFGLHPGSIGEGCIILIIAAAVFLALTKTASWEIMVSTILSAALLGGLLLLIGIKTAPNPIFVLLSGSLIFVAVFMATDPVSAPKNIYSKWIFGIIIGVSVILIRTFSLFPEGTSFGVLIGNTFGPLLDEVFSNTAKKKV